MKVKTWLCIASLSLLLLQACKKNDATVANPQDTELRLNQVQVIASHNSYHKRDTQPIFDWLLQIRSLLPAEYDPNDLDYSHLPFAEQFDQYPVRGLEIDIYNDPQGGAFYYRHVNRYAGFSEESFVPELKQPGFKVLHIKDVDYNSTYNTFVKAIQAVKDWSDKHPNHLPVFINIETKQDGPADNSQLAAFGFTAAPAWTGDAANALDEEIKSVFGPNLDKVLTPDRIRGSYSTLRDMARAHAWPRLGDCRGKVVFIMEGNCVSYYKAGHASLTGRACFTYANPNSDEAAFVIMNNAVGQKDSITARVRDGYIVRTRSDANTTEARSGDYSAMNAGFASGAHIISTDYYRADPRGTVPGSGWTTFQVKFPNGELARKNPVSADSVNVDTALKE